MFFFFFFFIIRWILAHAVAVGPINADDRGTFSVTNIYRQTYIREDVEYYCSTAILISFCRRACIIIMIFIAFECQYRNIMRTYVLQRAHSEEMYDEAVGHSSARNGNVTCGRIPVSVRCRWCKNGGDANCSCILREASQEPIVFWRCNMKTCQLQHACRYITIYTTYHILLSQ